ncbi:MAG TPA: hypothetical protein VK462_06925 [Nitrososphaeraceae archaeon]|nr:hypothetical protein [Nitrososphaeraceae archaeon]
MKNTKIVQSYKNTAADKNRSTEKNTKSGFVDPARIKEQNERDQPKDGIKSPWDFRCPQYDQRSSNFVNAGTHYGVGINQPIGHKGDPKRTVPVLPQNHMNTLQDDDLG